MQQAQRLHSVELGRGRGGGGGALPRGAAKHRSEGDPCGRMHVLQRLRGIALPLWGRRLLNLVAEGYVERGGVLTGRGRQPGLGGVAGRRRRDELVETAEVDGARALEGALDEAVRKVHVPSDVVGNEVRVSRLEGARAGGLDALDQGDHLDVRAPLQYCSTS